MLRIDLYEIDGETKLVLAGKLAGPWVAELQRCWDIALSGRPSGDLATTPTGIQMDLSKLTFIDDAGKELVLRMRQAGVTLLGTGLIGRFMCREIEKEMRKCKETE